MTIFELDSSFILHSDTFYPDLYALESVNFPGSFVKSRIDGRLRIGQRNNISDYYDTASFRVYVYIKSSECSVSCVYFSYKFTWACIPALYKYFVVCHHLAEFSQWLCHDDNTCLHTDASTLQIVPVLLQILSSRI